MFSNNIFRFILPGIIMLFLEYFVLLRLYQRKADLHVISLILASAMAIIAVLIGYFFKKKMPTIFEIFIIVLLMELPLSLKGYEIKPDASIIERMIVAGGFGRFSYALSEAILSKTPLIKL